MAVVNKDFKVKNGLIVEGTTGTINNYDILTKDPDDQTYIIGLIGGSAVSTNTPDTVVLRDGAGSFAGEVITAEDHFAGDLTGDVTGTVSDLSNHNTDDLSEGTSNKYYTDGRVKDVLTGSTQTNISIQEISGVLHITAENGVDDSTTDDLDEGTTNKYFTEQRVRDTLSGGDGITFGSSTGEISANLMTGGGLKTTSGAIEVDRSVVDGWYDANGAAGDVAADLSTHEGLSSGVHGVTGSVVGTTDSQDLSNKRFIDTVYFTDGVTINNEGEIAIRPLSHDFDVQANYGNLNLKSTTGDVLLDPNGTAYYGSASAENEIATHSYVDNAVSGLDWKQAVHLLYDAAIPVLSGSGATQLVVDGHPTLGDADSGYRILLAGGTSTDGIYVYNSTGGSWTLTRSTDADTYQELIGAAVYVMEGTTYGGSSWVQSSHYLTSFTGQNWTQFSGAGTVTAGTGIIVNGLEVSVDTNTIATQLYADSAVGTHSDYTSNIHGVTGDVVGTSDAQTLSNKEFTGETKFHAANGSGSLAIDLNNSTGAATITNNNDDLTIATNGGDIVLNANGDSYIGSAVSGNEIATKGYVDNQTTDDVSEGTTNKYYTDQKVRDVLTGSTQTNISITEVSGVLTITAENGVADSTTDDLDEGVTNHYFTDQRAKDAATDLLVNAQKTNISIYSASGNLYIEAENGVADSTTDDLDEGSSNLYFTDARAVSALEAVVPNFSEVEINSIAKQIAAVTGNIATASTVTAYSFPKVDYRSAKLLVKCAYGTHTELTEVLLTLDSSDNIAITEYAIVGTNGSSMSVSADIDGSNVRVRVTTVNNNSVVTVMGTLVA